MNSSAARAAPPSPILPAGVRVGARPGRVLLPHSPAGGRFPPALRSPAATTPRAEAGAASFTAVEEEGFEASLYDLLGVPSSVSAGEIKKAYKHLARKYHPDVSPPERAEEYTQRFIEVQEAYETLSDPRRRALYDRYMCSGFSGLRRSNEASIWILTCGTLLVLLCFCGARRAMKWLIRQLIRDGHPVGNFQLCLLLVGMMVAAIATDTIGLHSAFGAFMFGLAVPNKGTLGVALLEKMEDLVIDRALLLPLYFAISGLKTNLSSVNDGRTAMLLFTAFVVDGKAAGTILISLGFLMNTRGVVELICILDIG
ncbi:hypothetical protein ZIOFF_010151 [Zingiber officinale]|uniref:J domain-containing protein n=1 Tax=Zingiber officinale TaxID=94328 RepID=A0A8J5HLS8_ZINOF|nr:hypothetical protein ZIOFF_010151 [Zingiber officinale]